MALLGPSPLHVFPQIEDPYSYESDSHVKYWLKQLRADFSHSRASNASSSTKSENDLYLLSPEDQDDMVLGAEAKNFCNFTNALSPILSPMIYNDEKESGAENLCNKNEDTKSNFENHQKIIEKEDHLQSFSDLKSSDIVKSTKEAPSHPSIPLQNSNVYPELRKFESVDETGSSFSVDTSILFASSQFEDPETLLFNLGFCPMNNSSIPARFFEQPSAALGIDVEAIHRSMVLSNEDIYVPSIDESPFNPISHPRFSESSVDITSNSSDNFLPPHIRRVLFYGNNENVPSIQVSQDRSVTPSSAGSNRKKLTTLEEVPEPSSNRGSFDMDKQKIILDNYACNNNPVVESQSNLVESLKLPLTQKISISDRSTCSLMTVVNSNNDNNLENSLHRFQPIRIDAEFVNEKSNALSSDDVFSQVPSVDPSALAETFAENLPEVVPELPFKTNESVVFCLGDEKIGSSLDVNVDLLNDIASKRFLFSKHSESVDTQESTSNNNAVSKEAFKSDLVNADLILNNNLPTTSSPQLSHNFLGFFKKLNIDGKDDQVKSPNQSIFAQSNNETRKINSVTPNKKNFKNGKNKNYISSALHSLSKILSPTHIPKTKNHYDSGSASSDKVDVNKYDDSTASICFDSFVGTSGSINSIDENRESKELYTPVVQQVHKCQNCAYFFENNDYKNHIQTTFQSNSLSKISSSKFPSKNLFKSPCNENKSLYYEVKDQGMESSGYEEDHSDSKEDHSNVKCPFGKNCSLDHTQRNAHNVYKKESICEVCEKNTQVGDFNINLSHNHFTYLLEQISLLRAEIFEQNRLQTLREKDLKEHFTDLIFDIKLQTEGVYFDNLCKEICLLKKSLQEKDLEILRLKNDRSSDKNSK
ncbi:uncharacterized protein LOC100200540 isoform X1 [Hydra vulgaris]|uniref:uncharacterized protein LOC100200540 isoform X1 n=1 Tax=Hydra vulgaris TaxID=6087 RepID=UPI001F5EAF1D|nr:uncharacterized protein LOC100200540 isoform X1 [Hydra vulgaris]XP_047138426.1 uncharacterized protein LOC100200540 isoform X1 [Hydra vulgaris]